MASFHAVSLGLFRSRCKLPEIKRYVFELNGTAYNNAWFDPFKEASPLDLLMLRQLK